MLLNYRPFLMSPSPIPDCSCCAARHLLFFFPCKIHANVPQTPAVPRKLLSDKKDSSRLVRFQATRPTPDNKDSVWTDPPLKSTFQCSLSGLAQISAKQSKAKQSNPPGLFWPLLDKSVRTSRCWDVGRWKNRASSAFASEESRCSVALVYCMNSAHQPPHHQASGTVPYGKPANLVFCSLLILESHDYSSVKSADGRVRHFIGGWMSHSVI